MKMKKIFLGFLVLGLFGTALFAAGGKQRTSGAASQTAPVNITYWDQNAGPERTPYVEQIIQWYHESQNKVQIKYVGVPQSQFFEKINVAIAGDTVPDVSGMQAAWLSGLIARKALLKLDDAFNAWSEAKQFDPGIIEVVRQRDINKGLYLLPTRVVYQCIWYRIDRFKEAGLAPPKTWDEFFNAAAKLTDPAKGQYGFSIRGGSGSAGQLQTILFAYSGNKEFFDAGGAAALRDPAMVEFLTKFAGMYNKYTAAGDVNYDYQAMVAAFDSGAANMIHHNIASLGEHQKSLPEGTYGAVFFPKSIKGYYASAIPNTNGYSVFSASGNLEEALDFLKFLGSEKAMSYWSEKVGDFPPRFDVFDDPWFLQADHLKNITAVASSPDTVYVDVPQYLPEYNRILVEIVEPGFQAVMLGRMKPAQLLDEWASAMEQAYGRYLTGKK
jgi:multiple sugar transport system substrate-binding protein